MNGETDVRVRFADRTDLPALWALLRGLAEYERMLDLVTGTPEALAEAVFGDDAICDALLAEIQGVPMGYALVYETFSSFRTRKGLWLEDLFVAPEARRTGAGRRLMAHVARLAVTRGCAQVSWDVLRWNAPAMEFYRSVGAEPDDDGCREYGLSGEALARLAAAVHAPRP